MQFYRGGCMEKDKKSVVILRHSREKRSKCSLEPLVGREGFQFLTARPGLRLDATGMILLTLGAPVLTQADQESSLLLLDSTWRLLPDLEACLYGDPVRRTLPPGVATAYPRVSKLVSDPTGGLASVEALYIALRILGQNTDGILDQYYWKAGFLSVLSAWEAAHGPIEGGELR